MEQEKQPDQTEKPLRAVIIDDEGHVRTILKEILVRLGFDVVALGKNGLDAVELFHMHHPDLMVLDINMPVMTGEEALMVLMSEISDTTVVMLTSMTDMTSVENCISMGADNYIRKDTPLDEIREIIRETMDLD